jgi:hypothetical protein
MAEKTNLYKANFHFSGWVLPAAEELYIKAYNLMRAEAVDLINPMFKVWNAEYTDEVTGEDDLKYNGFIADKEQTVLDMVNAKLSDSPVKLYADRETADIRGKFTFLGKEITMYVTLTPYYG